MKNILFAFSFLVAQSALGQTPEEVVFPPLSRIGLVLAPCAWVNDAPDSFGRLHCGKFGWGEVIELKEENPIVWERIKGGEIKAASVYPYGDDAAPVTTVANGSKTLYTSEMPQGAEGEGWIFQVVGEINGLPMNLDATIQNLAVAKCSQEELKKSLLSAVVRPPLTLEQFQKETPILPQDMAGFQFHTTDAISIYFRDPAWPAESSRILTDHQRSLHFHCTEKSAAEKPDFAKFKVGKNGVEDMVGNFKDDAFKVHTHQQLKQNNRLWFIFEASGPTFGNKEEFLGYYICHEKDQPTLFITVQVPATEREAITPRITTFRESLTFVRSKRSRDE
jgi:hypothetical protein